MSKYKIFSRFPFLTLLIIIIICTIFLSLPIINHNNKIYAQTPQTFTIAILPDTQMYTQSFPEIFTSQTQWIKDHKDSNNIAFVLHEGDITNLNQIFEWQNANNSLSILDGQLPYILNIGNHDFGDAWCRTRDTTLFNTYFPVTRFENLPTFGDIFETGKMDNSYHLFSAG